MKRLVFIFLSIFFTINISYLVFAGNCNVNINNSKFNGNVINVNGTTYIESFDVENYLGAKYTYKSASKDICFERADLSINMRLNSNSMLINNREITMNFPPQIFNNKVYVPLKNLSEALGYSVEWDNATKYVNIDTNGIMVSFNHIGMPLEYVNINNIKINKIFDKNCIDKELFDKMFKNGWEISNTQKYLSVFFDDYDNPDSLESENDIYTTYTIRYKDNNNIDMYFELSNTYDVDYYIPKIILNDINNKYTRFLLKNFNNTNIDVDFNFVGGSTSASTAPGRAYDAYINEISKSDNAIDLSSIDVDNVFSGLPVYCDICIKCNSQSEINSYKSSIIDTINKATNNTANVCLKYILNDEISVEKYYVNGKEIIKNPSVLKYMSDLTYNVYKDTLLNISK